MMANFSEKNIGYSEIGYLPLCGIIIVKNGFNFLTLIIVYAIVLSINK